MINSSFPKVADQIIAFNKNLIDSLSKIDKATTTDKSSIDLEIFDEEGVLRSFSMPSFKGLKSDIDRLNNNINSLYSIDNEGSMIQSAGSNNFRKIITVDLNRDPLPLSSIGNLSNFKSKPNLFFDSLLDPMLKLELDLSGRIEENVSECLVRKYVINFEKNSDGVLTEDGNSALNNFNDLFRNNSNIILSDFQNWHKKTTGVLNPENLKYNENKYQLNLNSTLYDGEFSVLRIDEDRLNNKLFYVLDTLEYKNVQTEQIKQLNRDDEVIINSKKSSSRYKVIEISESQANPRVRFERIEGLEPISTGVKTLKIYSPITYDKKLNVNINYNQYNILFIKPINSDNNLVAKKWSLGSGFYTNDLRVSSDNNLNGLTMVEFYKTYVNDYGAVLKDMVSKNIPTPLAIKPNKPELNENNFKIVQINKHLTDTPNSNIIKEKTNYKSSLKSEIKQIDESISERNKNINITKSSSSKKQSELELEELVTKKESKSKLLSSITQEIIDASKSPMSNTESKYRLRGFWKFPESSSSSGSISQEIVQFIVKYKYLSADGTETNIEQFDINGEETASFSNWKEYKTPVRKRVFDSQSGEYFWEIEDVEDPDSNNINQIDLPIKSNEKIKFKIKSISEVGFPDSQIESDWSETLIIEFPEELNNNLNENENIIEEAKKESTKLSLENDLRSKGLYEHLSNQINKNDRKFHHNSDKILSGFQNEQGKDLDLFQYLKTLEDKIKSLEEKLSRAKGLMKISILRNNEEYVVDNGSETVFNVECEEYLDKYEGDDAKGRVYDNNIYVIRDFVVKIENTAIDSKLGLLSDKSYLKNKNVYSNISPECFWVNEQDELLRNDITSQTRTQLDNQFIWTVNYDSISSDSTSKLSENIGNSFIDDNSNSLTDVLSSSEYNIGYNENNILTFNNNNDSLLDPTKWIDNSTSVDSTKKLLTSVHPVVKDLENIVEKNSEKVKNVNPGESGEIVVPLNIYFKMNSLDSNQTGDNYEYINLNRINKTTKHIKKVKFLLENESENRPFTFSVKFNINRNNVIVKKSIKALNKFIK